MRVFLRACGMCLGVAFVLLCLIGGSCDDDPPNGPEPARDYPFYFADIAGNIFTFHPLSQRLDSATVPWGTQRGVTVSADGRLLYLAGEDAITVVTSDSFAFVTTLPHPSPGPVAASPDGRFIAICGGDIQILQTSDYAVVFSDTAPASRLGRFSDDGETFYVTAVTPDRNMEVYQVDLTATPPLLTGKRFAHGYPFRVIPSPDQSRWFLYTKLILGGETWAFEVYDVAGDSIVFRDTFAPGLGDLAATPYCRYLFYTGPGRDAASSPPAFYLKVFDVEANAITISITESTHPDFFTDSLWFAPPHSLAVTPDGRWLGILGGKEIQVGLFYVYDIAADSLVYRAPWDLSERFFTRTISAPSQP